MIVPRRLCLPHEENERRVYMMPRLNPLTSLPRGPRARFALGAGGLMISYYIVGQLPWVDGTFFPAYLHFCAELSALVLRWCGVEAVAEGVSLRGDQFAVNIKRGCDGIEPAWLLGAAILAYPLPVRTKWLAMGAGIILMQLLNLIRITSLFVIGKDHPTWFPTAHLEVWPALFVVAAVSYWWWWVQAKTPPASAPPP